MPDRPVDTASLLLLCGADSAMRSPEPRHVLILVEGPDAPDFVHRLCSQDVLGLHTGLTTPAAFLDPKGKLVAIANVVRDQERVFVETPTETAEALFGLLDRYHFTEKLRIERFAGFEGAGQGVEVFGSGSADCCGLSPGEALVDGEGVALSGQRHGVSFLRAYGPAADRPELRGLPVAEDLRVERLRILGGWPRVGTDSEPTTLGLEADLDDHVSTTKGCYTGQEIVARIHTYGHVNRKLVRLRIDGAGSIEKGTPLCTVDEGAPLGRVTSSVDLPGQDGRLALGYLPGPFLDEPEPIALATADGARAELIVD